MMAAGLAALPRLIAAEQSHIAADEESGPAYLSGARETLIPAPHGRLDLDALKQALAEGPGLVCVTEATEDGTVYGIDGLAEICALAHAAGSQVLVDGARLPNALASYGATLADVWATGRRPSGSRRKQGRPAGRRGRHQPLGRSGVVAAKRSAARQNPLCCSAMVGRLPGEMVSRGRLLRTPVPPNWLRRLGEHRLVPVHSVDINLVFLQLDPECAAAIADWAPASLWDRPGLIRFAASWDTGSAGRSALGVRGDLSRRCGRWLSRSTRRRRPG